MRPYISIIVPAFNAVRFLGFTLDSLLTQSFTNFEIILLNDGSKDNTAKIASEYAKHDSRVIFIDKPNEGVATTRNKGIDIAQGEYIFFVDADDIIFPDSLKHIVNALKDKQPDLLRYEFQTIDKEGNVFSENYEAYYRRKYANIIMPPAEFMQCVMRREYQLCFNVFRHEILTQQHIHFMAGCTYNEDTLFIIHYFLHCKTCLYVPVLCYGYRKYDDAVTAKFTKNNFDDVFNVFKKLNILANNTLDRTLANNIMRVSQMLGFTIYKYLPQHGTQEHRNVVKQQCLKKPLIAEWKYIYYGGDHWGILLWKVGTLATKIIRKLRCKLWKEY